MKKSIFFLLLISISSVAFSQAGTLDSSFSDDGILAFMPKLINEEAEDVAVTLDGRILVLVRHYENYIFSFLSNGVVDPSFGTNGVLELDLESEWATSIAVDSLNRILILGSSSDYDENPDEAIVYRFNSIGEPDLSFAVNGERELEFDHAGDGLLLQPDGKIICTGWTHAGTEGRIQRLNEDGTFDDTFVEGEYASLDYISDTRAFKSALDANGNILVTGKKKFNLFVSRLLPTGIHDSTFSENGYVVITSDETEAGNDIISTPDGKIVVTGFTEFVRSSRANCWRFLGDGSLDISFGISGILTIDSGLTCANMNDEYYDDEEYSLAGHQGWSVIKGNDSSLFISATTFNGYTCDPVVYKFHQDGTPDPDFGTGGFARAPFTSGISTRSNIIQLSNGEIILCSTEFDNGNNRIALSKFLADGSIDSTFGINGKATTVSDDSFSFQSFVHGFSNLIDDKVLCSAEHLYLTLFKLLPNGDIDSSYGKNGLLIPMPNWWGEGILAEDTDRIYCVTNPDADIGIIKLFKNGTIDTSYATNGISHPSIPDSIYHTTVQAAAIQPNGKVLVCFNGYVGSGFYHYVVRISSAGTCDSTFGTNGFLRLFNGYSPTIATLPDGSILSGESVLVDLGTDFFRITKLHPSGAIDSSFGGNGSASFQITNAQSQRLEFIVQSDNKILLKQASNEGVYGPYLIRLNEDGSLDNAFGNEGEVEIPENLISSSEWEVIASPDGKLFCGGANYECGNGIAVIRLNEDGTLDTSFGSEIGYCDTISDGINGHVIHQLHLQSDGKLLVGGKRDNSPPTEFYFFRLFNDSSGYSLTNQLVSQENFYWKVFPNPTSTTITLSLPFNQNTILSIFNLLGEKVKEEKVTSTQVTFDVSSLPQGLYLVRTENRIVGKFVKE